MPVVSITDGTRQSKSRSTASKTTSSPTNAVNVTTSGAPPGGTGDWQGSVDTRLSELRTDMRNLLIGGAVVALALGGVGWGVYHSTNTRLENMAVSQKEIQGKIETLDAKLSGRFDMLNQRLDDKSKASP